METYSNTYLLINLQFYPKYLDWKKSIFLYTTLYLSVLFTFH